MAAIRFESDLTDTVLWPRGGANPVDQASKNDYFDSMYHSAAAVGINTSAQIESGIVGHPVFSVRVSEYAGTQEGTLHFHYLLNENGGLLHMAGSLDEHVRDLTKALDRTEEDDRRLRSFVEGFVRPAGLDRPATPILADAIEDLARMPKPAPWRPGVGLLLLRALLYPVGVVMKVGRSVSRLTRKRERQMRPLTIASFFQKRLRRDRRRLLPLGSRQEVRAPLHRSARLAADDDRRPADAGDAGDPARSFSAWPPARGRSSSDRG